MFEQRQNRTMTQAAFTTLALIYHQTVHELRKSHRNALVGLLMAVVQSLVMVAGFYLMFSILGVRRSPLRGDFMIYIMSGIFMFFSHNMALGAVTNAGSAVSDMMKHEPMNPAVTISAAALAVLYQQTFSSFVLLGLYHAAVAPVHFPQPVALYGMLLLAWFTGCSIGMIFLAMKPWWPAGVKIMSMVYQRINMIASGKMFVANVLPGLMLKMFDWNPLFHIIDQTRGFAFINYNPHNSSLTYPVYFALAALMVGLMGEFVTRNAESLSWTAGH